MFRESSKFLDPLKNEDISYYNNENLLSRVKYIMLNNVEA